MLSIGHGQVHRSEAGRLTVADIVAVVEVALLITLKVRIAGIVQRVDDLFPVPLSDQNPGLFDLYARLQSGIRLDYCPFSELEFLHLEFPMLRAVDRQPIDHVRVLNDALVEAANCQVV